MRGEKVDDVRNNIFRICNYGIKIKHKMTHFSSGSPRQGRERGETKIYFMLFKSFGKERKEKKVEKKEKRKEERNKKEVLW